MSCTRNELLTSGLLTDENLRNKIVGIYDEIDSLAKNNANIAQIDFLEKSAEKLLLENLISGKVSAVAKASVLSKIEKALPSKKSKVKFLESIGTIDLSIDGDIFKSISPHLTRKDWDNIIVEAKDILEKNLVFDYVISKDSTSEIYKSIKKDFDSSDLSIGEITKRVKEDLMGMSDEELNKQLKGNAIWEEYKREGVSKKDNSIIIDNILVYNSILGGSREGINAAISAVRASKAKISGDVVIKALEETDGLREFASFVRNNTKEIVSVAKKTDIIDRIKKKRDVVVTGNGSEQSAFVARVITRLKDLDGKKLVGGDIVAEIDVMNSSFEQTFRALNNAAFDIGDPQIAQQLHIPEETINRLIGLGNAKKLKTEVSRLVARLREIQKKNTNRIGKEIKAAKDKLKGAKKRLKRAKGDDVSKIKGEIEVLNETIKDLSGEKFSKKNSSIEYRLSEMWQQINSISDIGNNRANSLNKKGNEKNLLGFFARGRFKYKSGSSFDMSKLRYIKKDRGIKLKGRDGAIGKLYAESLEQNGINISKVRVFNSMNDLRQAAKKEGTDGVNVVFANQDDYMRADAQELLADFDIGVLAPESPTLQGQFIVNGNQLIYSSLDESYIRDARRDLAALNIVSIAKKSNTSSVEKANEILQQQYDLEEGAIDGIIRELGFGDYNSRDINRRLSLINEINKETHRTIINPQQQLDYIKNLSDAQIDGEFTYLASNIISSNGFDVDIATISRKLDSLTREEKVNTIFSLTYGKSLGDIVNSEIDLIMTLVDGVDDDIISNIISKNSSDMAMYRTIGRLERDGLYLPTKISKTKLFDLIKQDKPLTDAMLGQILKKNPNIEDVYDKISATYNREIERTVKGGFTSNTEIEDISSTYFVKDRSNRMSIPLAKIPTEDGEKAISMMLKQTESLKEVIVKEIQLYKDGVERNLSQNGTMPNETANLLKRRLMSKIREAEENIDILMGRINSKERSKTFVFGTPKITEKKNLGWFNEQLRTLADNYNGVLEDRISLLKNTQEAIQKQDPSVVDGKIQEAFKSLDSRPVFVDGKVTMVTKNEEIVKAASELPSNFDYVKENAGKLMNISNEEKFDLLNVLRALKRRKIKGDGIISSIFKEYGVDVDGLKNVEVVVDGYGFFLPKRTTKINTSDIAQHNGVSVFTHSEDLLLKEDIYKAVSKSIKKGERIYIGQKKGFASLENIVGERVKKYMKDKKFDSIADKKKVERELTMVYAAEFSPYSAIPNIPENVVKKITDSLSDSIPLSEKQRELVSQFGDKSMGGSRVGSIEGELNPQYPDILHKEDREIDLIISEMGGRTEIDKANTRNGIKDANIKVNHLLGALDKNEKDFLDILRKRGVDVMKKSPRLTKLGQVAIGASDLGHIAADELRSFYRADKKLDSVGGVLNRGLEGLKKLGTEVKYTLLNRRSYDERFIYDVNENYKKYMKMSTDEFNNLSSTINSLSSNEKSAVKIAQYYRYIRSRVQNASLDPILNQKIYDGYSNILEGIVKKDGDKYSMAVSGTKKGGGFDVSGHQRLDSITSAMRQGEIFYGLRAFSDMDVAYKTKKTVSGVFDEFGSEEGRNNFNRAFGTDLNESEYSAITLSLLGDTKYLENISMIHRIFSVIFGTLSSPLFRLFNSMPGTLVSGIPTLGGYAKAIQTYKKANMSMDMTGVAAFMQNAGILRSSGGDFASNALYSKVLNNGKISNNPIADLFEGMPRIFQNPSGNSELATQLLDNGQNLYDALMTRALKHQAFVSSLQSEGFASFEEFASLLKNKDVPMGYRQSAYDRVVQKSYQGHEGMVNYMGSSWVRGADNSSIFSKATAVLSLIASPINFRGSLGMNAISNTARNLQKLVNHASRYRGSFSEVASAIGKDPVLKNWIFSRINDISLSLKVANLNNQGEDGAEQKTEFSDIFTMLKAVSQNYQIMMTAGPMRVLSAYMSENQEPALAALGAYVQNFFKHITSALVVSDLAAAYMRSPEKFAAYMENQFPKLSTGALRYMTANTTGVIKPKGTGIDPMFGGENWYVDMMYSKNNAKLRVLRDRVMGKESEEFGDKFIGTRKETATAFMKQLFSINKVYRQSESIIENLSGWLNEKASGEGGLKLPVSSEKMTEVYQSSQLRDFSVDGVYVLEQGTDKDIVDYIERQVTYRFTPGDTYWAEAVKNMLENGEYYRMDGNFKKEGDEDMAVLMSFMKDDGVLQGLYNKRNTTNDKSQTKKDVGKAIVSYMDTLDEERASFLPIDGMKLKIDNTVGMKDFVSQYESERKKNNKRINERGKSVQGTAPNSVKQAARIEFLNKTLEPLQRIYSDQTIDGQGFSNLGLDIALYDYAKNSGQSEGIGEYFYLNEETGEPEFLKKQYSSRLKDMIKIEKALLSDGPISDVLAEAYNIFGIYNSKVMVDGKSLNDTEVAIRTFDYMKTKALEHNLPQDKITKMFAASMADLGTKVMPIRVVRAVFGDDMADSLSEHIYQANKDVTQLAHATIDTERNGVVGSSGSSGTSVSVGDLAKGLKAIKDYVSENADEIFKPRKFTPPKFQTYTYEVETPKQRRLKTPQLPVYKAKSRKILGALKKKKTTNKLKGEKKK